MSVVVHRAYEKFRPWRRLIGALLLIETIAFAATGHSVVAGFSGVLAGAYLPITVGVGGGPR